MSKPIKQVSINAPNKDTCTSEHFVKFILVPQYEGIKQSWSSNYDIRLTINLYEDSVDMEFFNRMDDYLRYLCPELLGRYILYKKD